MDDSRQLTAQSRLDLDDQQDRGPSLAMEAYRSDPLPDAADTVVAAAQRSAGLQRVFFDNAEVVLSSAISPDGRLVA